MSLSPPGDAYAGFQGPEDAGSELNKIRFLFEQFMAGVWTGMLVKVTAVNQAATLTKPALVDIQPMTHQVDGDGNAVPHAVIFGVPAWRMQAGTSAVIINPVVGDIGWALFAHRDISAVKTARQPTTPATRRRFSASDAVYLGSFLGVGNAVVQYIILDPAAGTTIIDPIQVTVTAPTVTVNASTKATVTTAECDLISANVNLGAVGGKKVVLDGDPVVGGGGGTVHASSTKVKAV